MTRVMHVLAPAPVGGLERVVQALASAQRDDASCEQVTLLALLAADDDGAEEFLMPLRARGVDVHLVVTPPRSYRQERAALAAHVRRHRPMIVHTHGAHADVIAAGIGHECGAATVTTMHGLVGGDWRNRGYEWLQRRACRGRDAVVAVARPLATRLIAGGIAPERMHVVRNAWRSATQPLSREEARRRLGLDASAFVLGWVGRLTPEKGLDVLLRACPALATFACHVAVLGEGSSQRELQRLAGHVGLGSKHSISWHGRVSDAARLLTAFDVLVISSRTEGTPMVLLEAMAAHVPVIATRVGGISDIVGEDEALLVPSEDPAALAQAIGAVRADPAAAHQRATDAHARLQREGDTARWVARYRYVYEAARAVSARPSARA